MYQAVFIAYLTQGLLLGLAALVLLAAALPIALVGYFSAIAQGKCAAGSMLMVGRRPEMQGKGMMMTAMVETYAVLALLISFLCVNAIVL